MAYVYLGLAVLFNVGAFVVFKSISPRPHDGIWLALFIGGLLLGAVNVGFFTKALRTVNLSIAYPIFAGGSMTLIALIATLVFSEQIKLIHGVGALLVFAGIAALTR